jgi:hypothetical protein
MFRQRNEKGNAYIEFVLVASFFGSEQESDEVPNWRWFQDLGSPADVGGGCDHGLWTANRLTGCRS